MNKTLLIIIACHLIGDYVLQSNFLAQSKGKNVYHLLVHCFLYCLPFAICFGLNYKIYVLFVTHFIIDIGKAKFKCINYAADQIMHYIIALVLFL